VYRDELKRRKSMRINGSKSNSGLNQPAGILVLETVPPPPDPQLRAFVWCRHHANDPVLPEETVAKPFPVMVGYRLGNGWAKAL
jgi:hypothetical protein